MDRLLLLIQYFNKNWRKLLSDTTGSKMVIDHSMITSPIADMDLNIVPREDNVVVDGWKYVGPGDIVLDVYLNLDHILDYPIDHHMVAYQFFIPWLDKSILKWFGLEIFKDFADIVINYYTLDGEMDAYDVPVEEMNTRSWDPKTPMDSWVWVGDKLNESVVSEQSYKKGKGLYLTFPKSGWETVGGYLMKALGIVTGVFTSVDGAIAAVNKKRKHIEPPLTELVIGSHGNGQHLLMRQGSEALPVDKLLYSVKDLVGPSTTVFFTACYGADFLFQLCEASSVLGGHEVYGAAGVYNYVTNKAQKGFYSCTMSPTDYSNIQNDYQKRNIIFGSDKGNDYLLEKGFCQRQSSAPINWAKNIWT